MHAQHLDNGPECRLWRRHHLGAIRGLPARGVAIRIQRQVGGNLAELMTTVAGTMRERAYLRRQVKALAAEGKLSAVILSVLPPGVGGFVMLTNSSYMEPMFHSALGWILLIGAILWLSVGVFWMSRLVKVEI